MKGVGLREFQGEDDPSLGVCIGTAVAATMWYFDALVALLVSLALLLHGAQALRVNARAGHAWWSTHFWLEAPEGDEHRAPRAWTHFSAHASPSPVPKSGYDLSLHEASEDSAVAFPLDNETPQAA